MFLSANFYRDAMTIKCCLLWSVTIVKHFQTGWKLQIFLSPSELDAPFLFSFVTICNVRKLDWCPYQMVEEVWRYVQLFWNNTSIGHTPCGFWGCKNRPAPFPGWMSYKATKLCLVSVLYLSMHYTVLLFIRAPFYVLLVFIGMCSVLVVLVKLSVLAKWLAGKTPLRKPKRGEGIVSRKPRPKSAHDFLGLLYYLIVLLCNYVDICTYMIYFPTFMARYSLFVLKVPLNTKQTNKQTALGT